MSQWSNFAPFGEFRFGGGPSASKKVYDAQMSALGPAFAGPNDEAETYADARCFGVARLQIQAAGAQDDPSQVSYLIDALEKDYRLYHSPDDTLSDRRAALTAAISGTSGSYESAIVAGLTALLGASFVHWRPMNNDPLLEVSLNTALPVHSPSRLTTIKKILITDRIFPGAKTVQYTRLLDDGNHILTGESLVVSAGNLGLEEVVTVTTGGASSFTATFTKPHSAGTRAITGPFCRWISNQRHSLVVVAPAVMTDSYLLNKINEFMRKTMTSVSTWLICTETAPGYVGPWVIGTAEIGRTPIGVSDGETAILTEVP